MAYAVSQWPYSPDPRQPDFDLIGYAFGQVPPWGWRLSTTNATGIAEPFNGAGVICKPFTVLPQQVSFSNVDSLPDDVSVTMNHSGFPEPVPPGPNTQFHSFIVWQGVLPQFSASFGLLWPTAILARSFPVATKVGIATGTMPDPLLATPVKWDT
jgi:hypothetical protein